MKKLGFILCCICSCSFMLEAQNQTNNPIMQDQNEEPIAQGSVLVTNKTSQKIKVEWQTSLSDSIKSDVNAQIVAAKANNFQATGDVEWFQDQSKDSINPLVYTLTVRVYDMGGTKLSEEEVLISRSYTSLTQDGAKNNLLIMINSNYTIDYVLK